MKWIGLTGGIACGKSTVSQRLKELDFQLVDADVIAKEVVLKGSTGLKSVIDKFGSQFLDPEGHLDRRKLAQHIFSDPFKKLELESILHPLIRAEVHRQKIALEKQGHLLAIYDMPLLMESKAQDQFDKIIVVSCTPEQQRERLRLRNQWSPEEIERRIQAQIPLKEKEQYADFILRNDQDRVHLECEILRLTNWLRSL